MTFMKQKTQKSQLEITLLKNIEDIIFILMEKQTGLFS